MIDKELIHQAAEDIDIFQADLTEEYERLRKPKTRKLPLWPMAVAACIAGFVAIFLVPPRETNVEPQDTAEQEMFHESLILQYETERIMSESFEAHRQRIKKKGERLTAYIDQQMNLDNY